MCHFSHTEVPELREVIRGAPIRDLVAFASKFAELNDGRYTPMQIVVVTSLYYAYRIGHKQVRHEGLTYELMHRAGKQRRKHGRAELMDRLPYQRFGRGLHPGRRFLRPISRRSLGGVEQTGPVCSAARLKIWDGLTVTDISRKDLKTAVNELREAKGLGPIHSLRSITWYLSELVRLGVIARERVQGTNIWYTRLARPFHAKLTPPKPKPAPAGATKPLATESAHRSTRVRCAGPSSTASAKAGASSSLGRASCPANPSPAGSKKSYLRISGTPFARSIGKRSSLS